MKNLLKEKRILPYKSGKEIQYILADNELSEKDLKKKISKIISEFKIELENTENDFDKFDLRAKQNYPDHLFETLNHLIETKSHILRFAKESKHTDISYAKELMDEISNVSKNPSKYEQEKIIQSRKIVTQIDKLQRQSFELCQKRDKLGTSKKRDELTQKIRQLNSDISKLYGSLTKIRDDVKCRYLEF